MAWKLAHEIRKSDRNVQIVFLTGKTEYVFEGYEIGAVRYLVKPVAGSDLEKRWTRVWRGLRAPGRILSR